MERNHTPTAIAGMPWYNLRPGKWIPLTDKNYNEQPNGNYAYAMSNTDIICVDVDPRNGGFESLKRLMDNRLGMLPKSYAEESKSKGLHIFYKVDTNYFNRIGLLPGIDIIKNGCIFTNKKFKRNGLSVAMLPGIWNRVLKPKDNLALKTKGREPVACGYYCSTPIQKGMRNQTLFGMAMAMAMAGASNWQEHLRHAGELSRLPEFEMHMIEGSVKKRINI